MSNRRNGDLPRSPDLGPPRESGAALGFRGTPVANVEVSAEARALMITRAARLIAEARGFCPGYELADWFAARAQVDATLAAERGEGNPTVTT
jgi:hypothetical protein